MTRLEHLDPGSALTGAVLDIFRLSNCLQTAGDRLVADLGLTSSRWQVLGTIVASGRSQPVAWLARDMGAARQNVQRIVNDMEKNGLVEFQLNPHHRRAQLVVLTSRGREVFEAAMRLQTPWIDRLSEGLRIQDIATTQRILVTLRHRLEGRGVDPA